MVSTIDIPDRCLNIYSFTDIIIVYVFIRKTSQILFTPFLFHTDAYIPNTTMTSDGMTHNMWSEYDLKLFEEYDIESDLIVFLELKGISSLSYLKSLPVSKRESILKTSDMPLSQIIQMYNLLEHYRIQETHYSTQDIPMTNHHASILLRHRDKLIGMIEADVLCDKLFSYGVLTVSDLDLLNGKQTGCSKTRELLNILPRKTDSVFFLLLQSLRDTEQAHIANMVVESETQMSQIGMYNVINYTISPFCVQLKLNIKKALHNN